VLVIIPIAPTRFCHLAVVKTDLYFNPRDI